MTHSIKITDNTGTRVVEAHLPADITVLIEGPNDQRIGVVVKGDGTLVVGAWEEDGTWYAPLLLTDRVGREFPLDLYKEDT